MKRTPLLISIVLLTALASPPAALRAQSGASERAAAVADLVKGRRAAGNYKGIVIAADKALIRVTEYRFDRVDDAWSDAETHAALEALASSLVQGRLCSGGCEITTDEDRLTLGRPVTDEQGTTSILVEIADRSEMSSGRRVFELRLARDENGWSVIDRKFHLASHAVPCELAVRAEARERVCGSSQKTTPPD